MKHILLWFKKFTVLLLAVLKPLGFWGAGAIAALDSSTIPVPMDVFITTWVWTDRSHAFLYVLLAAIGSAIGGLLPFLLGRAGGELFLLKRIDRARYEQLRNRFEKQEFVALLVPSCLPPPTPWKLFAFAAGVFEMRVLPFMGAVFLGRMVRFGAEALITLKYGPEVASNGGHFFHEHEHVLLWGFVIVLIVAAVWLVRRNGRQRSLAS